MVDESATHTCGRVPTAAEIARDITVAIIGRSAEYNPALATVNNVRSRVELVANAYEQILQRVKEKGIG